MTWTIAETRDLQHYRDDLGMTVSQIAQVMHKSDNAIRSKLARVAAEPQADPVVLQKAKARAKAELDREIALAKAEAAYVPLYKNGKLQG